MQNKRFFCGVFFAESGTVKQQQNNVAYQRYISSQYYASVFLKFSCELNKNEWRAFHFFCDDVEELSVILYWVNFRVLFAACEKLGMTQH